MKKKNKMKCPSLQINKEVVKWNETLNKEMHFLDNSNNKINQHNPNNSPSKSKPETRKHCNKWTR